jgi:hypothetical protein
LGFMRKTALKINYYYLLKRVFQIIFKCLVMFK